MKITKRKILRFILWLLLFFVMVIMAIFFFRNAILKEVLSKAENKFKQEYNADFSIKEAKFDGLSGLSISEVTIVPRNADTLVSIQKIKTEVNIIQLISGGVQIENLELKNGFVQLVKNKNGRNFDAFLKSNSEESDPSEKPDYADFANTIISKILNYIPTKMNLDNVSLRIDDMGKKITLKTDKLSLNNQQLTTKLNVKTNSFEQNWNIKGLADPRNVKADLSITNADSTKIQLPYIKEKFNIATSFDNLHFKIDNIDMSFGELSINGFTSVDNLTINNARIARKDVVFEKGSVDFKILIGSDFVSLKEDSKIIVNNIKINPYFEYNTENDKVYTLKVTIPRMKAQDFINSLPKGLFSHFQGMEAQGDFDYKLDFKINIDKPWKLTFNSRFNKLGLRISKYGEANLNKLNSEFEYSAIENGRRQRAIFVGAQNPFYTPLDQISPYLQKSVLTCEDPSFMTHRGFIAEAFKQSIAKNIRAKRFARGASTISMQLVKNVFLTREKTLSRKLEEILLVYILENNRIATKERMLEVYFNVIEWGPNVYGIGEAAQFYFQKRPIDLSLNECLFLASIVPKPKKFMYQFDDQGNLKANANNHQEFISKIMLRRGLLTPEDTIGNKKPIYISGFARSLLNIKLADTVVKDSIRVESEFE
jgi:hypothetical protein